MIFFVLSCGDSAVLIILWAHKAMVVLYTHRTWKSKCVLYLWASEVAGSWLAGQWAVICCLRRVLNNLPGTCWSSVFRKYCDKHLLCLKVLGLNWLLFGFALHFMMHVHPSFWAYMSFNGSKYNSYLVFFFLTGSFLLVKHSAFSRLTLAAFFLHKPWS